MAISTFAINWYCIVSTLGSKILPKKRVSENFEFSFEFSDFLAIFPGLARDA